MKADIELPWSEFKTQLDTGKYQWIHFDRSNTLIIFAKQNAFTILCKINKDDLAELADFTENYFSMSGLGLMKSKVITEFELDDKVLKLASGIGTFDGNGDCTIEIPIPGAFDPLEPSRYIAGGYANTDLYGWGDRCTEVNILDKDNILGMGAGAVLETYHDNEVAEENRGWRFYASEGGEGEIEIEPIGGFGKIPGGLYLQIKFKRANGNPATKVQANLWWGKKA